MKQNTIGWKTGMHHQLILIGGIPGWPVINACCTMPMEIGNIYIMIIPFSGEEQSRSLPCD